MAQIETVSVGQSGDVPIPPSIREAVGIDPGSIVTLEARNGTIVIRPVAGEAEVYSPQRQAEFLLSNAVDAADYATACEEVRKMGLDPDQILHHRPAGV
jgi:AbrB family looped-hinge helix DNA binding protein